MYNPMQGQSCIRTDRSHQHHSETQRERPTHFEVLFTGGTGCGERESSHYTGCVHCSSGHKWTYSSKKKVGIKTHSTNDHTPAISTRGARVTPITEVKTVKAPSLAGRLSGV